MGTRLSLTPAERELVEGARRGRLVDWSDRAQRPVVRAEVIRSFLVGELRGTRITPFGLAVRHAAIDGDLDLRGVQLETRLGLLDCAIGGTLYLRDASTRTIILDGSETGDLVADRARIAGGLLLRRVRCRGTIGLREAEIDGAVDLEGASLEPPASQLAIDADFAKVSGALRLWSSDAGAGQPRRPFVARGPIHVVSSTLGALLCDGTIDGMGGPALMGDDARIGGRLFLRHGFRARGTVSLVHATVAGVLDLNQSRLDGRFADALVARGLVVGGSIYASRSWANGAVRLDRARIEGGVDLTGSRLVGSSEALTANTISIGGPLHADGLMTRGEISLIGARIGGSLELSDVALAISRRHRFLTVDLDSASIAGNLLLRRHRHDAVGPARLGGRLRLVGARIGADAELRGLRIADVDPEPGIYAARFQVGGALWLAANEYPAGAKIDLELANAAALIDEPSGWPDQGSVTLDGFQYERLGHGAATDWPTRSAWLRKQPALHLNPLRPQPFEHLAAVLRSAGHEDAARKVGIEKRRLARRSQRLPARLLDRFLDWTVAYGYATHRALFAMIALAVIGTFVFGAAYRSGAMLPTDGDARGKFMALTAKPDWTAAVPDQLAGYPAFQPLVYSIDVLLPIIDLEQSNHWLPVWTSTQGWWFVVAFWLQTVLGWVLSSLLVAALSGLIKHD